MIATWLIRPRPTSLLVAIALVIGIAHTLTLLPAEMAWGQGAFWAFPRGTINGAAPDFAQVLDGYLHFQLDTWHWPLLLMSHVDPPAGTNLLWLDAVPWVSLVGKITYGVTGLKINFLGPFQFACFALPGVAMVAVLVAFGQRSLLATLAGATLSVALPFHLVEWGHIPLCGQSLILLALALYGLSLRPKPPPRLGVWWFALLALALLTNIYLFVMVGAIWAASVGQRILNGIGSLHLAIEAIATIALIVAIAVITGILGPNQGSIGSYGFGEFSLNLGSPIIPQKSGVIPPLADYLIGARVQVFGYLGLGVLLALLVAAINAAGWWWRMWHRHAALLVVLLVCYLFALSYRVTLGSHVLLQLPLPDSIVYALGMFRSSGRFFWPVGYAVVVLAVATIVSRLRPPVAALVLAIACLLQLVDISPMRAAIARTSTMPAPPVIDRQQAERLAADVRGLMLFPTYGCLPVPDSPTPAAVKEMQVLAQKIMEFHLIAARRDLPINSVNSGRPHTNCIAEAAEQKQPLKAGILYVYFDGNLPDATQLGGADPAQICRMLGDIRVCKTASD
jgi:hypothetical protein